MIDLISRQDVLKLVDKGCLISNGNYQKVRKMVEALPSAEPPRWRQLRETISEMVENGGAGTQEDVLRYLLKYMDVLENEE